MSKAFIKESDEEEDRPEEPSALPVGFKNYMTPRGHRQLLEIAQVVDPGQQKNLDQVFFGAIVTYAHERGAERTITIVGVDEADLDRGQVSWVSPIARALMKARKGDILEFRTPAGIQNIELLGVRHGATNGEED